MRPHVYIADLRHDFGGVLGSDCMPLGIAYVKAVMDLHVPEVESRLFAYPAPLLHALQNSPPDVLMCSNYVWNEQLSLCFLRWAKQIRPQTLTVMGGPNIHLEPERQLEWMQQHPYVDVYILGEGDFLASEITREYLDAGLSNSRFAEREPPSCLFRDSDGGVRHSTTRSRKADVDDIPSPWLSGIQDQFFDGKLAPMIETNRGCPFKCTFCVQGVDWYTKVHYFDLDRIKAELDYIAARIRTLSPAMTMLRIADSNYGMFERDIEISAHIGALQRRWGWPTFIDVTTGKNRPERVIRSVEEASGAQVIYLAVQSLDEQVLRNVKRQNIKLEAYNQLQMYIRGRGLRTNSDLILCLPGETLESHTAALNLLLDQRIDQMHNLQLLMLKGSELEKIESRELFTYETRYRLGPKNYGEYGGEKVFDYEEIVISTDTLSFDDYLTSRKMHFVCSVFWNDSWFEDAFRLCDQFEIPRSQVFHRFLPVLEADQGAAGTLLRSFVEETRGELFDSPESLNRFYQKPENFERLCGGDVGENLMYKYRALASFHHWQSVCKVAVRVFRGVLEEAGIRERMNGFETFWPEFAQYLEMKHASGPNMEALSEPAQCRLRYDLESWAAAGCPLEVDRFRLSCPQVFRFELTEAGLSGLQAAFAVWSSRIQGLAKLVTRIQIAWQVRTCRPAIDSETQAELAERAVI